MKASSILYLAVLLLSVVTMNAQIKVFDGRFIPADVPINKAEKDFVRKAVMAEQKAIEEIGAKKDFKCAEYSFYITGSASGSFTKRNSNQKAYLYSICLDDGGKYASLLGGLLIVERKKIVAHFAYSYRWFDWMRSLPDINSNGFSELVMGFTELQGALSFTRSAGIYEINSNELDNMAILTSKSYSSVNDESQTYKGYVKKGNPPVFYAEEFELSEKNKWIKTKNLKPINSNKETERFYTRLRAY